MLAGHPTSTKLQKLLDSIGGRQIIVPSEIGSLERSPRIEFNCCYERPSKHRGDLCDLLRRQFPGVGYRLPFWSDRFGNSIGRSIQVDLAIGCLLQDVLTNLSAHLLTHAEKA